MKSMYDDIISFMKKYFHAYSEKGQVEETQHFMDKFYAPDLVFDDGVMTSREQWYIACLAHPAIQDKLTLEHLFVDEKQKEAGALVKTQAIDRASGKVLLEMKLYTLYNLKIDQNKEMKIARVKVFLESDPQKAAKLIQLYGIGSQRTKQ
jgi:hypothetical protein